MLKLKSLQTVQERSRLSGLEVDPPAQGDLAISRWVVMFIVKQRVVNHRLCHGSKELMALVWRPLIIRVGLQAGCLGRFTRFYTDAQRGLNLIFHSGPP